MALTPPRRPPPGGGCEGVTPNKGGPLCRGGVRRIQAEEGRMCSGAQAAEGRVCRCEPSAPAARGEVCRCEPSGPGPEGASGAAPRGLCRGRQGSARRDGAQQPARWGHIVPRQADRPAAAGPGRKATRSAGRTCTSGTRRKPSKQPAEGDRPRHSSSGGATRAGHAGTRGRHRPPHSPGDGPAPAWRGNRHEQTEADRQETGPRDNQRRAEPIELATKRANAIKSRTVACD